MTCITRSDEQLHWKGCYPFVGNCMFKKCVLSQVWWFTCNPSTLVTEPGRLPYIWGQFGIPREFQAIVGYSQALSQETKHTNKLALLLPHPLYFISLNKGASEKCPNIWVFFHAHMYVMCVYMFACRMYTCVQLCGGKRFKMKVFNDHFPPCSLKQKLSLNLELTDTAILLQGSPVSATEALRL